MTLNKFKMHSCILYDKINVNIQKIIVVIYLRKKNEKTNLHFINMIISKFHMALFSLDSLTYTTN